MNERRFTFIFLLSLLTGGAATYGVYRFVGAQKVASAQVGRIETAPVVVLAEEVSQGSALEASHLTLRYYPAEAIPGDVYTEVGGAVGRVARTRLYPGEPILERKLAPVGAEPGIEVKITLGQRAMVIRVSDVVGVAGFIRPESRVDVLVTMGARRGGGVQTIGKIILQNMRVLSVGTQTERSDQDKPNQSTAVTLEVTPEQAEILAVAMQAGSLSLALRTYGDPGTAVTYGATVQKLLAGIPGFGEKPVQKPVKRPATRRASRASPVAAPPAQPMPSSHTVQIYRGTRLSEETFEKKDSVKADSGGNQ